MEERRGRSAGQAEERHWLLLFFLSCVYTLRHSVSVCPALHQEQVV